MYVSVIIPFYNAQKYLSQAIDSCLMQKEVSEIILVDDGSNDESNTIAKGYESKNDRIRLITHLINKGRSASRNSGMAQVDNEFFAFLDADYLYRDGRFERAVEILKNDQSISMTYGPAKTVKESEKIKISFPSITEIGENIISDRLFEYLLLSDGGHFCITACTFRTSKIKCNYRFDVDLKRGEDTDFIWQIVRDLNSSKIEEAIPLTVRRVHEKNANTDTMLIYQQKTLLYGKWLNRLDHPKMTKAIALKIRKSYAYYKSLTLTKNRILQQWYKWKFFRKSYV